MKFRLDEKMHNIRMYLWEKYGSLLGDSYFYPLEWYVSTGRASTEFLKKLIDSKLLSSAGSLPRVETVKKQSQT